MTPAFHARHGFELLRKRLAAAGYGADRAVRFGGSLALAILVQALLGACLAVRLPEPGAPLRVAPGEGLVFGRVRVFERGRELSPWRVDPSELFAEDPVVRLALFHVESGRKRPDVPVSAEGRFEWILPAGTYLLYHTPSIEPPFNEPVAAFQVTPGSDPVDLGELHLLVSVDRPLNWSLATYSLLNLEAHAGNAETAAWFLQQHSGTSPVRQGAFVVDPELGGLFTNWSREACARILARHGVELEDR